MALDVFGDRSGWSALEELNLLNAIEHYSFGNWKDIAQHIGTRNADGICNIILFVIITQIYSS